MLMVMEIVLCLNGRPKVAEVDLFDLSELKIINRSHESLNIESNF